MTAPPSSASTLQRRSDVASLPEQRERDHAQGQQPWIGSAWVDGAFILAPPLLAAGVVMVWRAIYGGAADPLPVWAWVVLVMAIDVGHVYSTLFRTYFDRDEMARHATLYTVIPAAGWLCGMLLYKYDAMLFWRSLAYLAAFHFVRQQYGFLKIYSRREKDHPVAWVRLDAVIIYLATLYPLIFWHANLPRRFEWFMPGDFLTLPEALGWGLERVVWALYVGAAVLYIAKEAWLWQTRRYFNVPKNVLVVGTAVAWYMGIVWLNGDIAFTVTNVVSHGVPYMALVYLYANKKRLAAESAAAGRGVVPFAASAESVFSVRTLLRWVPLFIIFLVLLGYLEEGLWDGFVWRQHASVFGFFQSLPHVGDHSTLAWLIPLLALPQITHYLLDGFIWRMHGDAQKETAWMKHTLRER